LFVTVFSRHTLSYTPCTKKTAYGILYKTLTEQNFIEDTLAAARAEDMNDK